MSDRVLHCWMGKRDYAIDVHGWGSPEHLATYSDNDEEDNDGTCMLPDGHDGEHEFTPDNEIGISFAPEGQVV